MFVAVGCVDFCVEWCIVDGGGRYWGTDSVFSRPGNVVLCGF